MFDPHIPANDLLLLPPTNFQLSDATYNQLSKASRALATLNAYIAHSTENVGILVLGSFLIKEGVASSAIENINTTLESVFQADISSGKISKEDKEVLHYREAILRGLEQIKEYGAIITNSLIAIQGKIEPTKTGLRKIPGTILANNAGEVIYTPPVGEDIIKKLLYNLEDYINNDTDGIDPLIKVAIIHYQFESIHPFPDGNGRTGRILMIMYLVLSKLLDLPILYLSEYINTNKTGYYTALQGVRNNNDWDTLVMYILQGIEHQAKITTKKLESITTLIRATIVQVETSTLKIPSGFIRMLFDRPYNNIKSLEKDGVFARNTIRNYLRKLAENNIIQRLETQSDKPYIISAYLDILYNN